MTQGQNPPLEDSDDAIVEETPTAATPVDPALSPGEGGEVLVRPDGDPNDPMNDPFNASHDDHQRKAIRREE
jgi:hypothetical protein